LVRQRYWWNSVVHAVERGCGVCACSRASFAVWNCRAYADWEEYQLVQDYIDHQLPLDILVTDMDWHDTFYSQADAGVKDQAGQTIGQLFW
jgi:hypothetical protein